MKVLVAGGSGYIGRVTIEALIAAGHDWEAPARSQNSAARVRETGGAPVVGALSDLEVLRSAASRSDAVIHLARLYHQTQLAIPSSLLWTSHRR